MNNLILELSLIIENNIYLAPIIAFIAGVLTSLSPCCLSSVPLVIGYVSQNKDKNTAVDFKLSMLFALGSAITYTILAIIASLFTTIISFAGDIFYIFIGVLIILMILQFLDIVYIIPQNKFLAKNKKVGYIGALTAGLLTGLFGSPCSTPILVVLLTLIVTNGSMLIGILLVFAYAIGNSIIIVIAGTSTGFVKKILGSKKYGKYNTVIKIVVSILMFILALNFIYLGL